MGIKNAKDGKLLYHLTDITNLPSIIKHGLQSRTNLIKNFPTNFSDIANPDIISKRNKFHLNDYIPFHFHPYSSFDAAVKNSHPNSTFIYLCITRDFAKRNNFPILPMHPLSLEDFQLLPYEEGFQSIDWEIMTMTNSEIQNQTNIYVSKYHHIPINYLPENVKHIKMAECLSNRTITIEEIHSIYVENVSIVNIVDNMLSNINNKPYINPMPQWFKIDDKEV